MRPLIAALISTLALAACAPTEPAPSAAGSASVEADCAARNGSIKRVGRLQTLQCVIRYADAGKRCTDGDQCLGDCRLPDGPVPAEGAPASGLCQVDSDRFGCNTTVEDGRVGVGLCID